MFLLFQPLFLKNITLNFSANFLFSKTKMANLRGGGESGVLGGEGIGQNQGAGTSTLWTGDDKHIGLTATKFSAV